MILSLIYNTIVSVLIVSAILTAAILVVRVGTAVKLKQTREDLCSSKDGKIIAFFHPACDSGGGGEKVLFQAIKSIQDLPKLSDFTLLIYSGSDRKPQDILKRVKDRFSIDVTLTKNNLKFIKIEKHAEMNPALYPSFTMLWQMLACNKACIESVSKVPCDVFIDTVGVGFAYPLVRLLFGCSVVSYTHYPTISSDMLAQIDVNQFNN